MSFTNLQPESLQSLRFESPSDIARFTVLQLAQNNEKNPSKLINHILNMEFTGRKEVVAKIASAIGGYKENEVIPEKVERGARSCGLNISYNPVVRKRFFKELISARKEFEQSLVSRENEKRAQATSFIEAKTF